jgi:hypothetical protein
MKRIVIVAAFSLIASLTTFSLFSLLQAQSKQSVDLGRTIFSDPALGTSGKTCSSCHPGGKGLENAAARKDLMRMINVCITGPLKGKELQEDSIEMRSLILYINSLGGSTPGK